MRKAHNFIDLTGKEFGQLTVIGRAENDKNRNARWLCLCQCGKTTTVRAASLISGNTHGCGCAGRRLVLAGKKFGRLLVMRATGEKKNGRILWECICDCGKHFVTHSSGLVSGHTRSCGCVMNGVVKHGFSNIPEFYTWKKMKIRCYDPRSASYKYYGGRGITVCERWRNSFENFYADMGPRPTTGHSIDRIDVNGNYEPGNCRWATAWVQANNRRARSSKLSPDDVREIRRLLATGKSTREIGRQFSVNKSTIIGIKNGRYWAHLKD